MKTKTFDCVEMKRKGAEKVYQLTKGMTREEEIEFWKQGSERLKKEIEEAKRVKESGPSREPVNGN